MIPKEGRKRKDRKRRKEVRKAGKKERRKEGIGKDGKTDSDVTDRRTEIKVKQ